MKPEPYFFPESDFSFALSSVAADFLRDRRDCTNSFEVILKLAKVFMEEEYVKKVSLNRCRYRDPVKGR
jgi:hypothetical protein